MSRAQWLGSYKKQQHENKSLEEECTTNTRSAENQDEGLNKIRKDGWDELQQRGEKYKEKDGNSKTWKINLAKLEKGAGYKWGTVSKAQDVPGSALPTFESLALLIVGIRMACDVRQELQNKSARILLMIYACVREIT